MKKLELLGSASSTDGTSSMSTRQGSFSLKPSACRCNSLWTSELHGLTQFISSKSFKTRFFWFGILAFCFCFAIFNTIQMLGEYIENETTTLITIHQVEKLQFPSLVVCPQNADAVHLDDILNDIKLTIPSIGNTTAAEVVRFAIAGFGFSSPEEVIKKWSNEARRNLAYYYDLWKRNRTDEQMFKLIFEQFGYTCEEAFYECYQSGIILNCCDIFYFTYVMLRARCLRLGTLFQIDNEETAKLSVSLRKIPSPLSDFTLYQPTLIIYVNDYHKDVWITPRYYFNAKEWTRMRFRVRRRELLTTNKNCRIPAEDEGTGTCAIKRWLDQTLIKPYNCTFVYNQDHNPGIPICKPQKVIENYEAAVLTPTSNFTCLPACVRDEFTIQVYSSVSFYDNNDPRVYILEASFTDLQLEQYKEVVRTTLPGFVSQLGGQGGLFLGASIITFVQFFISFSQYCHKKLKTFFRQMRDGIELQ